MRARALTLSFIIPLRPRPPALFAAAAPWPFIPNKAISNSCGDGPYVRLLGDNLYTRTTYVITYSLDTSFSRAATRRFHGFVPPRGLLPRGSHCRAATRNSELARLARTLSSRYRGERETGRRREGKKLLFPTRSKSSLALRSLANRTRAIAKNRSICS